MPNESGRICLRIKITKMKFSFYVQSQTILAPGLGVQFRGPSAFDFRLVLQPFLIGWPQGLDFITAIRMRWSEFLRLKMNLQNYHSSSEVWGFSWSWSGPTNLLLCQCTMHLIRCGAFPTKIVYMEMECWWEQYVEVELAMAKSITFRKMMQSQECEQTRSSVVVSIFIVGHCSVQTVSHDDVQTSDLNRISFQRALS